MILRLLILLLLLISFRVKAQEQNRQFTTSMSCDACADCFEATIDLMVLYSLDARQEAGSVPQIEQAIEQAVDEANKVNRLSGVNLKFNLVDHSQILSTLGRVNATTTLSNMASGASPFSNLSSNRTNYGADLVVLVVADVENDSGQTICGAANTPSQNLPFGVQNGYSIVEFSCMVNNLELVHQLGHNLGLDHDTPNTPLSCENARGYINPSTNTSAEQWYTIMATDEACKTLNSGSPTDCYRIPYWSNPALSYAANSSVASPLGTSTANAVASIKKNMCLVANYQSNNTLNNSNIIWAKTYGEFGTDLAQSITKTNDGGFVLAGTSSSVNGDIAGDNNGRDDFWVVKLNQDGFIVWSKSLGLSQFDKAHSLTATSDGGFAITGHTNSYGNLLNDDFLVIKIDANGNEIWKKNFNSSTIDEAYSIIATSDGGLVVAGQSFVFDESQFPGAHNDAWLIKLNNDGEIIWENHYGSYTFGAGEGAASLVEASNGDLVVVGFFRLNHYDYWITRIDSEGNEIWSKKYGGTGHDRAYAIVKDDMGNFLIAGTSTSNNGHINGDNHGLSDIWILKIDENGNRTWAKSFGGSAGETVGSIKKVNDGGFIIAGSSASNDGDIAADNHGGWDYWTLKIDTNGNKEWAKSFGGSDTDSGEDIIEVSDNKYLFVGSSNSNDGNIKGDRNGFNSNYDYWGLKFEVDTASINTLTDDQLILSGTYHGNQIKTQNIIDVNSAATLVASTSITMLAGFEAKQGSFFHAYIGDCDNDAPMARLTTDSYESPLFSSNPKVKIYPNPVQNELFIEVDKSILGFELEVFDLMGRLVYQQRFLENFGQVEINGLEEGIYFLRIDTEITKKIIINQ